MSFCICCLIGEMQGRERVLFYKVSERNCRKAGSGSHRRKRKCIPEQTCRFTAGRFGRQVRRRALSALREGCMPLSRVEPRINSSLGRDDPRFFIHDNRISAKRGFNCSGMCYLGKLICPEGDFRWESSAISRKKSR